MEVLPIETGSSRLFNIINSLSFWCDTRRSTEILKNINGVNNANDRFAGKRASNQKKNSNMK